MADRIQVRRDTEADWTSNDPTLAAGEPGFVSDTNELVIGDGSTAFTSLKRVDIDASVQTYTPSLTAATTDPTLGSGGTIEGWYREHSGVVEVWVRIKFGTSGTNAGAGTYIVSLPTAALASLPASTSVANGSSIGSGHLRDDSASGSSTPVGVELRTASTVSLVTDTSTVGQVSAGQPWAWAANDVISFHAIYPKAA